MTTSGGAVTETDAVVIGAGPVGLFQVFELGLHGIHCHLIDALPAIGGQCALLYPEKPIFDIPGTPRCTGRELIARLHAQIAPFHTPFHLNQEVSVVEPQADGRFRVATCAGEQFIARCIVIAGGVGSFQARRLKVDGLQAHEGRQVFHRADALDRFKGQHVLMVGEDDIALQAAITLASPSPERAASVTLMHRRDAFKATTDTVATMRALCDAGAMRFIAAQANAIEEEGGRLTALHVDAADGSAQRLPLDALLVLQGLSPRLGPIADWGLALDRKQLVVDTAKFETSVPGIFAVGDVNTYPGKRKLIVSGFHEATLAAFGAAAHLRPGETIHLEYTTTSPRLLGLLQDAG